MSLMAFLLVGLTAGFLAGKIVDGSGFGLFGDIAIGVIGAFIGGSIFGSSPPVSYGFWGAVITATVGAVCLLLVTRLLSRAIGGRRA